MEAYTLDRNFERQQVVDAFNSFIWTERFYGDGDCEIVVPATKANLEMLAEGTLIELNGSAEPMILEVQSVDDGIATITGISLLRWLNNRFIRASSAHVDRYWNIEQLNPDQVLSKIVYEMCVNTGPIGIPNPTQYLIPNLETPTLFVAVASEPIVSVAVPYGPIYDALFEIATTYQLGMRITLDRDPGSYSLRFSVYRGNDRTSQQSFNPVVQFSPQMESLTDVEELRSIAAYKTHAFSFAPSNPGGLATNPGSAVRAEAATGFDLRAVMVFADDITTDKVGGDAGKMQTLLDERAARALAEQPYLVHVDGEIVPTSQFLYGRDYQLGDIIEIAGYSGAVQNARVTEYIRSHDETGEKAYPSVTMIS
jgi:hypothetical protein